MIVYIDGEYCEEKEAKVLVSDRAFVFADGAYEGFRIYNNTIFKYDEHKKRFQRSLDGLRIDFKIENEIIDIYNELKKQNNYKNEDLFFYMQISRGKSPRAHAFPKGKTQVGIYAFLGIKDINIEEYNEGTSVCTVPDIRWERCDIKCISLVANCMASQIAIDNNCSESLFVKNEEIREGSHTNVFFVKNNEVFTYESSNDILSGITREVIIDLCKKNDIKINEVAIRVDDLENISEAFLSGTTKEITPIIKIDNKNVGDGKTGKICKQLQKLFKEEVQRTCY